MTTNSFFRLLNRLNIYVYFILSLTILMHFFGKYLFLLDAVPIISTYNIINIFYGKVSYGEVLSFNIFLSFILIGYLQKEILLFILFMSGYFAHLLACKITMQRTIGLYSGLLYMINPFTYIRILSGHWYILISYALVPLLLMKFIDLLEKKEIKEMINFILILSFVSLSIHMLIIALIIMTIIFIFWFNKYRDIRFSKIIILCVFIYILLNSYWIVPLITVDNNMINNIGIKDFEVYSSSIDGKYGLFDIMAMYGFWKEGYAYSKDFLYGWQVVYLIILSLAIIGFISYYKDKKIGIYIQAFALIGILGFILASGFKGPFSNIIYWLFDNTLLKGMRDTHKFVAMIVLSYSILGGLGLNKIKSLYVNKQTE